MRKENPRIFASYSKLINHFQLMLRRTKEALFHLRNSSNHHQLMLKTTVLLVVTIQNTIPRRKIYLRKKEMMKTIVKIIYHTHHYIIQYLEYQLIQKLSSKSQRWKEIIMVYLIITQFRIQKMMGIIPNV